MRLKEVDVAVVEVFEGVSKVVVMMEVSVVSWDYISIIHLVALQGDNVLETIVVLKKQSCVEFEK